MEEYIIMQWINGYMRMVANVFIKIWTVVHDFLYSWIDDTWTLVKWFLKAFVFFAIVVFTITFFSNLINIKTDGAFTQTQIENTTKINGSSK